MKNISRNSIEKKAITLALLASIASGAITSCSIPNPLDLLSSSSETSIETSAATTAVYIETTIESTTIETSETEETYPTMTDEDLMILFAQRIKGTLLGRDISEDEVSSDALLLVTNETSIVDYLSSIVASDEFVALELSDDEYVERLNITMLNGELGINRKNMILGQLEAGISRESVIPMLAQSSQFLTSCSIYGVTTPYMLAPLSSTDDLYDVVTSVSEAEAVTTMGGYFPSEEVLEEIYTALDALEIYYRHCSFLLVDVNTGRGIGYNVDRQYYSASSIKGPYCTSLCYYHPEAFENYEYSIQNILINSDNDAFALVFNTYLRQYITDWAIEAQVNPEVVRWKYPRISPRDMCRLWIRNYQYFMSEDPTALAIQALMQEPAYSLIHSELGELYVTESKAGWMIDDDPNHTTTVDAGIVHAINGDYIIVIESTVPCDIEPLRPIMRALNHAHDEMTSIV